MSAEKVKVIFDEKIIEKFKKKSERRSAWIGRMLPILVAVIFAASVVSFTLLRTKYAYLFDKDQKILYVKNNILFMSNADGSDIIEIDNGFTNVEKLSSKSSSGTAVYDKITKQILYLKNIYESNQVLVGALKLKSLTTGEVESIENDVLTSSIYYNEKSGFCYFEKLTNKRGVVDIYKIDLRNKNKVSDIASNVKKDKYQIYRDTGKTIYLDSTNQLYIFNGNTSISIDTNVEDFNSIHHTYEDENLYNKVYYIKPTQLEKANSYNFYEYDIASNEMKLLFEDINGKVNVLPDGTFYYVRDNYIGMPYTEFIDVNSTVNDIRQPSAMTKQKIEGIEFVVYKNNIYDSSDVDKVNEVMDKYNVELSDYQFKVEKFNEFSAKIATEIYPLLYRDLYYYDGYHEYKLNEGNVYDVNYFDGGVFFKIAKEYPIVKLKLSDIVNKGAVSLNSEIDALVGSRKGFYYVYKGLNSLSIAALNSILNESVNFVNADRKGNINISYSYYVKEKLYNNLVTISPELDRVEENPNKNKYTAINSAEYYSDNKREMIKYYDSRNGVSAEIGGDSGKQNIKMLSQSSSVKFSNNDKLLDEELIPFWSDYDSNTQAGVLHLYNGKSGRSIRLSDNVQGAVILGDNEALFITSKKNGGNDLRYGKNILTEDVSLIFDMMGNNKPEKRLKPIDLKEKKNQSKNKNNEVEEVKPAYIATRSYLVAGVDFSEAAASEAEIPYMQKSGFETLEDGSKVYNKGNLSYARNEWVDIGAFKYHFNEKGEMDVSKWIDDLYYVNHVGVMVKNTMTPDGYRVDANGEFIDDSELKKQAARLAEETTKKAKEEIAAKSNLGGSTGSSGSSGSSKKTTTGGSSGSSGAKAISIEATELEPATKKFYVAGYKRIQSFIVGDDNDCDIVINYPIINGADQEEVALINEAIEDSTEHMMVEAEGAVESEDVLPSQYIINKAKVSSITNQKVTIVLTGTMVRPAKGNKSIRITITYDRESGSSNVSS